MKMQILAFIQFLSKPTFGAVAFFHKAVLPGAANLAARTALRGGGDGWSGLPQNGWWSSPAILLCWVIVTVLWKKAAG